MSDTIFFGKAGEKTALKVVLFGFGKHPALSEHQTGLGKSSASLLRLQERLYWDGIQKFSNTWESLPGEARCEADHWLFLSQPGRIQLGRIVSTADASGRKVIPFIVVAEVSGCPVELALRRLAPALDDFTQRCLNKTNYNAIEADFAGEPGAMESLLASAASELAPLALSSDERAAFTSNPDWDSQGVALGRLLYKVESSWAAFAPQHGKAPKVQSGVVLRVPAVARQMAASVLLWEEFARSLVHRDVPRLYIAPAAHEWLDLVVGEVEAIHFKGLRAGRKHLGLETEVPHAISLDLQMQAQALMTAWRAGTPLPMPERPADTDPNDTTTRFFQRPEAKTDVTPGSARKPTLPLAEPVKRNGSKKSLAAVGLAAAIIVLVGVCWFISHGRSETGQLSNVPKIEARTPDPPPAVAPEITGPLAAQRLVEGGKDLALELPVKVQTESVAVEKLVIEAKADPTGILEAHANFTNGKWQLILSPLQPGSAKVTLRATDERGIPSKRISFDVEVTPKPPAGA